MRKFRILIVEDEANWVRVFQQVLTGSKTLSPKWATTSRDAWALLANSPFHFVSIDQNLPVVPGETVVAGHGLDLLSQIVDQHPFVRTTIYTAFGKTGFANRAGRLGKTEYFEKRAAETNQEDALDALPYFDLVETMLSGGERLDTGEVEPGYILWALQRGQHYLPPALALQCDKILKGFEGEYNGSSVLDGMSKLLERTVELAWAQASALYAAQHSGSAAPVFNAVPENNLSSMQKSLGDVFDWLEEDLGQWLGYITDSDRNQKTRPGQAFLDATHKFRLERNPHVHEKQEFSRADFEKLAPAWLDIIDGLAFWADFKLMNNVGIHPDDRDQLRFLALEGKRPWQKGEIRSQAKPPSEEARRLGVHMLYRPVRGAERLVNLFPFVSMIERAGRTPEPALMLPAGGGRGIFRRSLETGEEIKDAPITERERNTITRLFGTSWRA